MKVVTLRAFLAIILLSVSARAAEYFVGQQGDDANTGLSREKSFLTIQKGVEALRPGDTLTIAPGEYPGNVHRDGLGTNTAVTTIRAEIPGTVILRGDIPVDGFRKTDGSRFTYVAQLACTGKVVAVNELDTLKVFDKMPNAAELDFIPGVFFHDQAAGKLYISTSDMQPVEKHRYTAAVIGTHGLYLKNPQRVVVEGLAVTGFNAGNEFHYSWGTLGGVWGIFIFNGKSCVIRDCRAWLNGWGIGLNSGAVCSGDNVIERCVAWANRSKFWSGDMGGLTGFAVRRDVVRDSTSFMNGMYGINIYGTGTDGGTYGDWQVPGNEPENKSRLVNNLAWGNPSSDFKIKTGVAYFHTVERGIGLGAWSVRSNNISDSIVGRGHGVPSDSILLPDNLDPASEFADPLNHDYRLQATSRFRGAAPDGKDQGPCEFDGNVFFVWPGGRDSADGLSVSNAWRSLARAASGLKPGDTLYIAPGNYAAWQDFSLKGEAGKPIRIRGRGRDLAVIPGRWLAEECAHVEFERLCFREDAKIKKAENVVFNNCQFQSPATGLQVERAAGLRVTHCVFTGFQESGLMIGAPPDQKSMSDKLRYILKHETTTATLSGSSGVYLGGNLIDNAKGAGLWLDGRGAVLYSDYNIYRNPSGAWKIGPGFVPADEVRQSHEKHSRSLQPEFASESGIWGLKNPELFAAAGPCGRPAGMYRNEKSAGPVLALADRPLVHSLSATTADIEWMTTLPATCELVWGEKSSGGVTNLFDVNYFGSYSLTGLKPGQTYHFKIKSLRVPRAMEEKLGASKVELAGEILELTTRKENPGPLTYYVATNGNDSGSGLSRQNAWKTIRHAAGKVRPGDTVLVAGGTYRERVRIRVTGETNAPITFKCAPGEKVVMDGGQKGLEQCFVAAGKKHLHFDGFYFRDFNMDSPEGVDSMSAGEFNLYRCEDVAVTRCFSDGRSGYTAVTLSAFYVKDLLVKNCVSINKMGGSMYFWRCPDLRVENTVFASPMIASFIHRNEKEQKALMENCIFTDMLAKKAALNIGLLCCDGHIDSFLMRNNCYVLRDCIPVEKRALIGKATIGELGKYIVDPVFADPLFAGDPVVAGLSTNTAGFPPDRIFKITKLDFNSYFATSPELVRRGIGLQPEAFKDFNFTLTNSPAK
ncbi:MAG: hypothetical protein WC299_08590 [Kiritimatiellia bacterium]